jgi:two-component system response regulator (stage 0 sporulation protein F)
MKQTLSILIVDDHPAMCRTLEDILADEGYMVTTVASGQAAVQVCQEQEFDVILMDVRMPDLNGVDTYRQLKNYALGARVIMMSAYSVETLKKEALQEGAIAFLKKPLDVEVVLKLVRGSEHPPVLLVMDQQKERESLAAQLKNRRYRTYTTGTPEEALELARQICFHVIMIDTHLHAMSALELYLALKEITPTSVTILFAETNETFIKQAEEAVKRCAYTFLTKPLDLDKLFSILEIIKQQLYSDLLEKPEDLQE